MIFVIPRNYSNSLITPNHDSHSVNIFGVGLMIVVALQENCHLGLQKREFLLGPSNANATVIVTKQRRNLALLCFICNMPYLPMAVELDKRLVMV